MKPIDTAHQFALDAVNGKILIADSAWFACQRFLNDLERKDWEWVYDKKMADWFIKFATFLKLSGGQWEGVNWKPLPWQEFVLRNLFGWVHKETGLRRFRRAYLETPKGPLDLDTPVLTTFGWKTQGTLEIGDYVYAPDGTPTRVIGVSDVFHDKDCIELEFDCGEKIVASADHEWITSVRRNGLRSGPNNGSVADNRGRTLAYVGRRTTREIQDTLRYTNGKYMSANHSIPVASVLEGRDVNLVIDPYILGFWLGDGNSDSGEINVNKNDLNDVLVSFGADKCRIKEIPQVYIVTPKGLCRNLRLEGLKNNKHIPEIYLQAGPEDRLALLQGLMDSDGYADKKGHCEFCSTRPNLADGVVRLCRSLGLKVSDPRRSESRLYGVRKKDRYRVSIDPGDLSLFRVSRKLSRCGLRHTRRALSRDHRIVGAVDVPTRPVRCITVEHPDHLYLAGKQLISTCNSGKVAMSSAIALYMLFLDREKRPEIFILAETGQQAQIVMDFTCNIFDKSPELEEKGFRYGGDIKPARIQAKEGGFIQRTNRPSGGRGVSGPVPHAVLVDELHEIRDVSIIELYEAGTKIP